MKCPGCKNATLAITERQGIEIDYCPERRARSDDDYRRRPRKSFLHGLFD